MWRSFRLERAQLTRTVALVVRIEPSVPSVRTVTFSFFFFVIFTPLRIFSLMIVVPVLIEIGSVATSFLPSFTAIVPTQRGATIEEQKTGTFSCFLVALTREPIVTGGAAKTVPSAPLGPWRPVSP